MRTATQVIRIIVGWLFVLSGLLKANDPLGLGYKMQEFFDVWHNSLSTSSFFAKDALMSMFHYLNGYALALAVIMITLEILAGVALLIGWRKKFVLSLLLILILFFTFLTAYAYGSGKFKNCGCFGDCLPISPLTSLVKDIILLAMILFLLFTHRFIQPWRSVRMQNFIMLVTLVVTLALQWYVLNFLPVADCLPFKVDNHIPEQMKPPKGSVPDSIAMRFIYEKDGKRYEFAPEELPNDLASYKYIDRIDKLIRKGNADAPIKGFALIGASGTDSTEAILQLPDAVLVFIKDFNNAAEWIHDLRSMKRAADRVEVPLYAVTNQVDKVKALLEKQNLTHIPVFAMDFTVIKTVARTNPTVIRINQGTIVDKVGYRDFDELTVKLK